MSRHGQTGLTLVELMVALAIGSFLIIGTVQIYTQSRQAYAVNESLARIQDTAQFAMDTIEADLRMAGNWGLLTRAIAIEGRVLEGNADPLGLSPPTGCGADWALNLTSPVEGADSYRLPCAPADGAGGQPRSDILTVRRGSSDAHAPETGRLQIQSSRTQGVLFRDGQQPALVDAPDTVTHNLLVHSYYVADDSTLVPGTPALRRKSLTRISGSPGIVDEEIAPGVENLQVQFGVDIDGDNSVDRYVNPGDGYYQPLSADYAPGARVITARIWLLVRGIDPEAGLSDTRHYAPGNEILGVFNDQRRRMQVSKTILLRNTRS